MKILQELLALNEMAKRSSTDGFYAMAKKKYGSAKVQSLTWPEIVLVAKENDVLIPPYLRTQKVGRGRFNLTPPDHADGKSALKVEPEVQVQPKYDKNLDTVASEIYRAFKQHPMAAQVYDTNRPEKQPNGEYLFDFRDWGHWEVPEGEEDDGDYDWEVPTNKTREAYRELAERLAKQYNVKVRVSTGEKNWLEIYVGSK